MREKKPPLPSWVPHSSPNSQLSTLNSHPYLLYVGNLHPRKNLVRLLEAFVILKKERAIPHKLKIVGQTAWMHGEIFRAVRDHDLENEVEFTGYLGQSELVATYQQATIAVYPSLYEGFGLPPLEAMACGCPVVTSNRASLPETTGNAAVLVDPEQPTEIANGVLKILGDRPLARELSDTGIAQARKFTWRRCAEQTLDAYKCALKAR